MITGKMEISAGVAALLANAHAPMSSKESYFFEGNLCQMAKAAQTARQLGIEVGVAGGLPYVVSKEDFNKVVQYIIDNQIEGYWHYKKGRLNYLKEVP